VLDHTEHGQVAASAVCMRPGIGARRTAKTASTRSNGETRRACLGARCLRNDDDDDGMIRTSRSIDVTAGTSNGLLISIADDESPPVAH
jgi:hypothetical protein